MESIKFRLIYCLSSKLLFIFNFDLYTFPDKKSDNILVILKMVKESPFTIFFV